MKILFTLISIDTGQIMYLEAAKRLCCEILKQTNHDILLSTNNTDFFSDIESKRLIVRNNIRDTNILKYGSEFNYNIKYLAFENIPETYDYIIYLDCDIKLDSWKKSSDEFMENIMSKYDFGADRLNCILSDEIKHLSEKGHTLFQHKISSYDILERFNKENDIFNSKLPSEHFFILKNDKEKINLFFQKWEELNEYLQNKNGIGGSWGDGFEIGISARYAGFLNVLEMNPFYWKETLGFKFNGNKYQSNDYSVDIINDNQNNFYESYSSLDLLLLLREKINKNEINFVQIGVNDGNDIANVVLTLNDFGYFIEPIETSYVKMCENKKEFKNCILLKKAILPELLKENKYMNLLDEESHLGASFGNFNKDRIKNKIEVDTISVNDFIDQYNIDHLDFLFCGAESLDHLIITDFVKKIQPSVIFFKTCWWCSEDASLETSDGKIIQIPSRKKMKQLLDKLDYFVFDYLETKENKQEDMLAVKKQFLQSIDK